MGKQKEGSLQERIQTILECRGGYCFKNHGDMTTEPGRPDIVVGYHGVFIAIEAKVDDNEPSRQQGIHCRNIWKSGNVAMIAWTTTEVIDVLDHIDFCLDQDYPPRLIQEECKCFMKKYNIDDGTRW